MLKNFNKTNFNNSVTITLLLISLIIIINNFFRFFQTKTAYQFAPWLNNYQGGFVRRGLPGEIFFQIHEIFNIHLGWIVFIFVSFLYLLFYFGFFKLIKGIKLNKFFVFTIFSPLSVYFPIVNSKATGHKEIIFLCCLIFFCLFLPKIKKSHAINFLIFILIFCSLSSEILLFYFPYLLIPFFIFYKFKNYKEIFFYLLPIMIIGPSLFLLIYFFKGNEEQVKAICDSVILYANANCQDVGKISFLKHNISENILAVGWYTNPNYFKIYITGFIIGFFPLFILYKKAQVHTTIINQKIYPLLLLSLPWILTLPIYYIAADWGRYLYISYLSSLIILIFCLKNKIFNIQEKQIEKRNSLFVKILFVATVIVYAGWAVPICCENSFTPGILETIEKYYSHISKI